MPDFVIRSSLRLTLKRHAPK
uniref:Uncharacterized protein n=1 Tax=Rhizophora mucronata TaxID=61149 RepID=A0A2P2K363_RHIMU